MHLQKENRKKDLLNGLLATAVTLAFPVAAVGVGQMFYSIYFPMMIVFYLCLFFGGYALAYSIGYRWVRAGGNDKVSLLAIPIAVSVAMAVLLLFAGRYLTGIFTLVDGMLLLFAQLPFLLVPATALYPLAMYLGLRARQKKHPVTRIR